MKLYVCWGTMPTPWGHPCNRAHLALKDAGHDPEVIRTYGWRRLPDTPFNAFRGKVKQLSGGDPSVPLLFTDDGEVVQGSKEISDWALRNPA